MTNPARLWIFAYGSLLFRPPSSVEKKVRGVARGYERAFNVLSTDHRGVPEQPGRVANLVKSQSDSSCGGMAYLIVAGKEAEVLAELDEREAGGYKRIKVPFESKDRQQSLKVEVLAYSVPEGAAECINDESLAQKAQAISDAEGPSGSNLAYVLNLVDALDELNFQEDSLLELMNLLVDPDEVFAKEDDGHKSEKVDTP